MTEQINALAGCARAEGDYTSEQFMQWFIKEQVEEVATMSDLLRVVERSKDDPMDIENFMAREHPGAEGGDPTAPTPAGRLSSGLVDAAAGAPATRGGRAVRRVHRVQRARARLLGRRVTARAPEHARVAAPQRQLRAVEVLEVGLRVLARGVQLVAQARRA